MRRALLTLSCSVLALGGLAAVSPAAAAPAPAANAQAPPPASRFQKVTLNDRPASR